MLAAGRRGNFQGSGAESAEVRKERPGVIRSLRASALFAPLRLKKAAGSNRYHFKR
jgi:hypothetical protein